MSGSQEEWLGEGTPRFDWMAKDRAEMGTFEDWLSKGLKMGWVSEPFCSMHDTGPLRDWEADELYAGMDPCIFALRLWRDGMEGWSP